MLNVSRPRLLLVFGFSSDAVDKFLHGHRIAREDRLCVATASGEVDRVRFSVGALQCQLCFPPLEKRPHDVLRALRNGAEERPQLVDDRENRRIHLCAQLVDDLADLVCDAAKADLVAQEANDRGRGPLVRSPG